MPSAVGLRTDFSAMELRRLAALMRNANQSRRLLSLTAVLDGMSHRHRITHAPLVHRPIGRGRRSSKLARSRRMSTRLSQVDTLLAHK